MLKPVKISPEPSGIMNLYIRKLRAIDGKDKVILSQWVEAFYGLQYTKKRLYLSSLRRDF